MNLDRMIERCRAEQWSVGDLDWDTPTPAMSEGDEANISKEAGQSGGRSQDGGESVIQRLHATLAQNRTPPEVKSNHKNHASHPAHEGSPSAQ